VSFPRVLAGQLAVKLTFGQLQCREEVWLLLLQQPAQIGAVLRGTLGLSGSGHSCHACSWDRRVVRSGSRGQRGLGLGRGRGRGDDGPATGQQSADIVEQNDSVAEQAPPLLRVTGHHTCGQAIRRQYVWASRLVLAHISSWDQSRLWRIDRARSTWQTPNLPTG
jgi:hypothetical protein